MRIFVVLLAIIVSAPAQAAWKRAESTHFIIYSDSAEKDMLRYAQRLEAVHYLMSIATATPTDIKAVKVRVYFVGDVGTVQRLMGRPNSEVAGYYQPSASGAIAVVPRNAGSDETFTGQVVLFHEYAHHFMLQYSPSAYPPWFVEGFAEIVSTASFERKGQITYGKAASHRQAELEQDYWIPTDRLLDGSYVKLPDDQRGAFYGLSWLLSHYLTFSDKRKGQLRAFITAMNSGRTQAQAAQVFGDLPQLQRELHAYLNGGEFPYRAPALPATIGSETVITPVSEGEAALIEERIEMGRRSRPGKTDADTARRTVWLADLKAKVERYATDPAALQLLADAECEAEDWTACEAAADRTLALAPQNSQAMLRKGEAMMEAKGANVAAARTWIVKANRAAPDAPEPLIAYYRSFGLERRAAPDAAISGLIQAMQTVPQATGVRLMLAQELIRRGRLEEARIVLEPLAFSPHRSDSAQLAQRLIDQIDGKKVDDTPTTNDR